MTIERTNLTRPRPPTMPPSATPRTIVQSDPIIRVNPWLMICSNPFNPTVPWLSLPRKSSMLRS